MLTGDFFLKCGDALCRASLAGAKLCKACRAGASCPSCGRCRRCSCDSALDKKKADKKRRKA